MDRQPSLRLFTRGEDSPGLRSVFLVSQGLIAPETSFYRITMNVAYGQLKGGSWEIVVGGVPEPSQAIGFWDDFLDAVIGGEPKSDLERA